MGQGGVEGVGAKEGRRVTGDVLETVRRRAGERGKGRWGRGKGRGERGEGRGERGKGRWERGKGKGVKG